MEHTYPSLIKKGERYYIVGLQKMCRGEVSFGAFNAVIANEHVEQEELVQSTCRLIEKVVTIQYPEDSFALVPNETRSLNTSPS